VPAWHSFRCERHGSNGPRNSPSACVFAAANDLTANVPAASVDVVTMVFVLSAISPEAMPRALHRVARTLRPGGQILFRCGRCWRVALMTRTAAALLFNTAWDSPAESCDLLFSPRLLFPPLLPPPVNHEQRLRGGRPGAGAAGG
jgi:SAM-dependent methyltransferase